MHCSKRFGCLAYPLLFVLLFAAASSARAQNPQDAQSESSSQQTTPEENPRASQIELARAAQARIQARRMKRVQQRIEQTYNHKYEVYGGGGYLRFRPGQTLQHVNETSWNAGFTDYFTPRLGATAEAHGYYSNPWTYNNYLNIHQPSISQYTFMGGPQYRLTRGEHWAWSAQVLAGAARGNFYANDAGIPGTLIGLWPTGMTWAVSAGVPIDYNITPSIAARLTPTYVLTHYGGEFQSKNIGFNVSLVYRFKKR